MTAPWRVRAVRRHARAAQTAALALLVAALSLAGCGRPVHGSVAALAEATGIVEAARAGSDAWAAIAPATQLGIDDAVRTGARSSARLALTDGGTIRMSENSRLRFRLGAAADGAGVEMRLDLGRAEMENTSGLSVVTAAGRAHIDRGSRVRVTADGILGTIEVIVGRAMLVPLADQGASARRSGSIQPVAIGPGQGVTLRIGTAVVEWFSVHVGDAVLEPETPGAGASSGTSEGPRLQAPAPSGTEGETTGAHAGTASPAAATASRAGGARESGAPSETSDARHADVTVNAGESPIVHDGAPPPLVRFRFDELCPQGASVELGRPRGALRRLSGAAGVVARLAPGDHPYRVRCLADRANQAPRATGVVTVKRDSGNVALARRAPTNLIEADGRRYTVLYQTRLPALTLSWVTRAAERASGGFDIHVQSASATRVFHTSEPILRLPAGALAEGEHSWWFVAPDGRSSPKTTVVVRFDNTAPTAQFFRAAVAPETPAGTIPIDGVTVKGAKVSIAGKTLAVDERGRFQDAAAPSSGDDAVAVRIETPHGDAHYYVKRRLPSP